MWGGEGRGGEGRGRGREGKGREGKGKGKGIKGKLVIQPSSRKHGQRHAEWQKFEKPDCKRQYKCMAVRLGWLTAIHFSLICVFSKYLTFHVFLASSSETWLYY